MNRAVLLGLFDGLHRGHMSAVEELKRFDGKKLVLTFCSEGFAPKGGRGLLMTDERRRGGLLNAGADEVIFKRFADIGGMSPKEFADRVLSGELCADRVICGENFRFGLNASAGAEDLKELMRPHGAEVKIVPLVYDGGEPISTTRIRCLLEAGKISEANRLLGYAYGFEGRIIRGSQIGRQMGIKTVNIAFDRRLALPKKGVYFSEVSLDGDVWAGVTNIGERPTVHDDGEIVIETHILGFDGDVYGESAKVSLREFLREEKRFGSVRELRTAVEHDIKTVKELISHE